MLETDFQRVANLEAPFQNSWSPAEAHRLGLVNILISANNDKNYLYNSTASKAFNERTYLSIESYNSITINVNSGNISDITTTVFTNTSNVTSQEAPAFTSATLTKAIFFGTMFLISAVGNVATLIQMRRLRRRKSTINTLIVNLALADLLVTFFCTAGEAAWAVTVQWLAGDAVCKLVKYMQVFSLYLSTYITVAISLDRCVAILDPMRRNGASQRVRIMILFAWIFSALFSIPQLLMFNVLKGPFKEDFYQCVDFGPNRSPWQLKMYPVASLMFAFVLPLAVIGTAYGLIFTTISRKSKEHSVMDSFQMPSTKSWVTRLVNYKSYLCVALCNQTISNRASITSSCSRGPVRSHLLRKAKRKSLRMSFVIVLAFVVCWAPYYIFFFYVTFLGRVIDPRIFTCFSFIGLSNTMLNPIIYGAFQLCKVHFYTPRFVQRSSDEMADEDVGTVGTDQNDCTDEMTDEDVGTVASDQNDCTDEMTDEDVGTVASDQNDCTDEMTDEDVGTVASDQNDCTDEMTDEDVGTVASDQNDCTDEMTDEDVGTVASDQNDCTE